MLKLRMNPASPTMPSHEPGSARLLAIPQSQYNLLQSHVRPFGIPGRYVITD